MTRTRLVCAGALAACLSAAAPAAAQNRVDQQVFLDLRQVQEQTQQLRLSVNTLIDQLKTVNTRLDAEATARNKGFADEQALLNNITIAIGTLQENVRDNKVQVQKLTQELDAIKKGVDILTTLVTQAMGQMPAAGELNAAPGSASVAPPGPGGTPPSANDYLQPGKDDYAAGHWDMAIRGFEEFLKRFPSSPDAASAQYFIGESNFNLGKFKEAVAAYDLVIKNYKSDTERVAEAYFKQGICYEQLNQKDKAIANFQLLQKDYKDTSGQFLALQALRRLGVIKES